MIKPFGDFYLIRLASDSGDGRVSLAFGTVAAVGDDMATFGTNGAGDTYYFRNGLSVKDPATGEEFVLVHYDDIVAYIEADETTEVKTPTEMNLGGFTDWIPWNGGECPVDDDVRVMVVLRVDSDGDVFDYFEEPALADHWDWTVDTERPVVGDIVYYRIV